MVSVRSSEASQWVPAATSAKSATSKVTVSLSAVKSSPAVAVPFAVETVTATPASGTVASLFFAVTVTVTVPPSSATGEVGSMAIVTPIAPGSRGMPVVCAAAPSPSAVVTARSSSVYVVPLVSPMTR